MEDIGKEIGVTSESRGIGNLQDLSFTDRRPATLKFSQLNIGGYKIKPFPIIPVKRTRRDSTKGKLLSVIQNH